MGLYLEPQTDKMEYLDKHANKIASGFEESCIDFDAIPEDSVLVCCVDNIMFYAAAIAYDRREFESFDKPDERDKYWYIIKKETAKLVTPMWDTYFGDSDD